MKEQVMLASRVRVKEDVVFRDLEGEVVLLNLDSGIYFGLDPVGTRIWALIQEHNSLEEVLRHMMVEYEVERVQCEKDLLALLTRLNENGLIEVSN